MKKRLLVLLLAALVSAALFAGGGSQNAAPGGALTEISCIFWNRGTIPPEQGDIEDNWWVRYVNEQLAPLGAKMTYVQIPFAQEAQTMSTMLAANNAPDISKTSDIPLLKTYIAGGGVTDITGYVDQYGQNIKDVLGEAVLKDIRTDGKIYFLPHLQNGITGTTTWIRTDWLDALGLPVPNNPEELYQAMKAVKERDPGKVGNPLVALGMQRQNFSGYDSVMLPFFVKEEPALSRFLVPFPMWPEDKDVLRWLNKLHSEGLLTDEFIIDKDDSIFRQKIARGEMFVFLAAGHYPYHSAYGSLYDRLRETNPQAKLSSINPFARDKDGNGYIYWGRNPVYQYRWFVPFSSKKAELAVKVYNWMSSPAGYMVGGFGIEGQDYRTVNNVPVPIDQTAYLSRVPWIEPQYGLAAKPYSKPQDKDMFLLSYIKDFNSAYHEQIIKEAMFLADIKYFPPTVPAPTPVSDKLTPIVSSYWNEQIAKIITAPPANFDRIFDESLREFRALGGDEIVAEAQQLYR